MIILNVRKAACLTLLTLCLSAHAVETQPKANGKKQAKATLKLAGIFGDNMVLQRNTDTAIWGKAKPGSKVSIEPSWMNTAVEAVADSQGKWTTKIHTPKAGVGYSITVKSGDDAIQLKNVLSGEVWLCTGQSNMQWKMRGFGVDQFKEDVVKAKFPNIRFCDVPQVIGLEEQDDVKTRWTVCSPKSVLQFSAVGYFFGSRLHQELNIPIGLISTNWGGSAIEGWISPEVLQKELPTYKEQTKNFPEWKKNLGALIPRNGKKPKGLNQSTPGVLYRPFLKS